MDALVASEPTPSLAEQRGGRELVDLGGLGNNYPLLLLVKVGLINQHYDALRRFFRAMTRAEKFIHQQPAEAMTIISKETGLTPEMTRAAMLRHSYRLQLDANTIQSLNKTALFLKEQKKIGQLPDLTKVIDPRFLPANGKN